jgi:transmembrane sensor
MDNERFLELAARYVSGAASPEEISLMQKLIQDPQYAVLLRKVNDVWLAGGKASLRIEYNTERGLDRLAEKLRKHEPFQRWGPNRRRFPSPTPRSAYFAMAGAVVAVLVMFVIRWYDMNVVPRSASVAWNEKSTRMGEKLVLVLPDGSTITLNGGSTVKYPAQYDAQSRDVYLEGEAYFEIVHNSAQPFIVHTGNVSTTDLGTKFDVSAFASDSTIFVALEEGEVEVRSTFADTLGRVSVLQPSQQFIFNRYSGTSGVESFDRRKTSGWKDNEFVFDNERLSTVLKKMERAFGVKFEVSDSVLTQRLIKADFHNESVWSVAQILKKATGLSYVAVTDNNSLKKLIFSKN